VSLVLIPVALWLDCSVVVKLILYTSVRLGSGRKVAEEIKTQFILNNFFSENVTRRMPDK
jgi:hypothetical protein